MKDFGEWSFRKGTVPGSSSYPNAGVDRSRIIDRLGPSPRLYWTDDGMVTGDHDYVRLGHSSSLSMAIADCAE